MPMLVLVTVPRRGDEGLRLHEDGAESGRRVLRPTGRCRRVGCDAVEEQGAGEDVERELVERVEEAEEEREELVDGRVSKPAMVESRHGRLGRRGYPARQRTRCGGAAAWGSHTHGTTASIARSGSRTVSLASPRRSTRPPAELPLVVQVHAVAREVAQQRTVGDEDEVVVGGDDVGREQHENRRQGPRHRSCLQARNHRRHHTPAWSPLAPTAGHDCPPPSRSPRRRRA